jgi:TPR repeat protein
MSHHNPQTYPQILWISRPLFALFGPAVIDYCMPHVQVACHGMSHSLIPLPAGALIGLLREALESTLVERGVAHGLELLGHAEGFWSGLPLIELRRMAESGNRNAQAELGWRHASGESVAKSYAEAVRWASASAEHACPAGEAVLGWLLYQGFGLPRDYREAVRLFNSAAAQGDARGMTWLGLCLLRGHGVEVNTPRAADLFEQAAQKGARLAQYWRGRVLYFGIGVERDFALAAHWLQLAAAQGQAKACDLLARCHFFGRGVR